ncbi:MAG: invasion associated locus B family protein [Alphaproteobacteria bacterium]|nr:invasion associated locus B family protein [Alphaproteobacteria bacterium]
MNNFQKYSGIALIIMLITAMGTLSSFAAKADKAPAEKAVAKQTTDNEVIERGWVKRCSEESKDCEIFQRIDVKKSSMRIAEFALGFPHKNGAKKGNARGVVILPLGILLEKGITMKVDSGLPSVFKISTCTKQGCFLQIDVSKNLIDMMKKGNLVYFIFESADGRKVNLVMSLAGFSKALRSIQ